MPAKKITVKTADFLFELGVEELPSSGLHGLAISLGFAIERQLRAAALDYGKTFVYATPRRLAFLVTNLVNKQQDSVVEKRGPSLQQAFDSKGQPTKACSGFAKSCGVEVSALQQLKTAAGSWVLYRSKKPGELSKKLLPGIITAALKSLPIKRPMHWGNNPASFIRPVHWAVMLYGKHVIKTEVFGIKTSNKTHGHRFHHPEAITITEPSQYAEILEQQGLVIADFEQRKELIRDELAQVTSKAGAVVIDEKLLEEVTGMVEWPVALLGSFEHHFLKMPAEVLIEVMKVHQRCFYLVDNAGLLVNNFVTIANIQSKEVAEVILGNEKVMRARLADAEFFYAEDLKQSLETYVGKLKDVVFQDKLGSLHDKVERVTNLVALIGPMMKVGADKVKRAAFLCKADLVTNMVREFPELQGVMGCDYAFKQNEPLEIAFAIKEHYLPRFSGDNLPATLIGVSLALADRLDSLVGIFGINQRPTGDKDPFALRRAALAIVRIILEYDLTLDLKELLEASYATYKNSQLSLPNQKVVEQVLEFLFERLRGVLAEDEISTNIFNAVLARTPTRFVDFKNRAHAVKKFLTLEAAEVLIAAHKRINNILKKTTVPKNYQFNSALLQEPIEQELYKELQDLNKIIPPLFAAGFYSEALTMLAEIKPTVDEFFDQVMVMVDAENLRNNRLTLLVNLRDILGWIADLSLLM